MFSVIKPLYLAVLNYATTNKNVGRSVRQRMLFRHKNFKGSLELMRRATAEPSAEVKRRVAADGNEPVQIKLHKSLRLWTFYVDLEESLGTLESTRAFYERILDLRIATPQIIINYALLLEDHKYFEDAFKFVKRYGKSKLERSRELFEHAVEMAPAEAVKPLYLQYAKLEEDFGLAKRAMAVYDQATKAVPANEQLVMQEGAAHQVLSAFVEIVFDNSDNRIPIGGDSNEYTDADFDDIREEWAIYVSNFIFSLNNFDDINTNHVHFSTVEEMNNNGQNDEHPPVDIWVTYLSKFVKRYGKSKLERSRELFEHAVEMAPAEAVKPLYLQYAKLEEDFGLAKRAMAVYYQATKAVPANEQLVMQPTKAVPANEQLVMQEGAGHQVLSAFVEIVFDNFDNRIPEIVKHGVRALENDNIGGDSNEYTDADFDDIQEEWAIYVSNFIFR
ncbi:pre-mRNA-splicing factor SYF1 [Artemisia annua]|uniref:Pre-mRNA-splicing factor SYF1 n=1 Tax=Artemisia annua TaxID=35608 RepID=A0A2U1M4H4_ARTAN|nr:pre-mRNA-splicing factor SYF1 [Artemisia annua]